MTVYDTSFLQANGYFDRQEADTEHIEGVDVSFTFDPDARLAYFEGIDSDRHQTIVSRLRSIGRNFDFYWFWNETEERVAVYNRYREHKWFIFNQSIELAADVRRSKEVKLESIDDGLETLFDTREVVDQLYRNLWDIRLDIARSFEPPDGVTISDSDRIMVAQRTIDRLIFCYFLAKKDVIHSIDNAGDRFGLTPEKMFETVLENGEFYAFLLDTFFTHLSTEGWTEYRVTDGVAITYPYLNGRLFRNHEIDTDDDKTITECDLDATAYDWTVLVEELNRYDWLIEEAPTGATKQGKANKLSPAVLGHIFEKSVITVSELGDEAELSLAELEEMNSSATGEQLLEGNRQVGAYYTPKYIAYENTRETLWNRVRTMLAENHTNLTPAAIPDPDTFFEEVHTDDSSYPIGLGDVEAVLKEMTVLDPSVGSGAFLMTAGEILEDWRYQCTEEPDRYEIRREIIRKSLYGVDLLEGAVAVCTLRLWLWLLDVVTVDPHDDPSVEALPNIDFNIRQGNSLIGVAEAEYDSRIAHVELDWTDGEQKNVPDAVTDYRKNILEYRTTSGTDAVELRNAITDQRELLRSEFDRIYAQDSTVTVEETVDSYDELAAKLDGVEDCVKWYLDFDSEMTSGERSTVSAAGFREQKNWPTTAYHVDVRTAPADTVKSIFTLMDGRGQISIERSVSPADIEAADPFHWIFEYPMAYAPATNDETSTFDVVIGNPPHGSRIDSLEHSVLSEKYELIGGEREVTKLFTERGWSLTGNELSYVVPKASTYNSNWEDFREYCLPKMHRGLDLGTAFRNVDHEQVTIHLSNTPTTDSTYTCGPLPAGAYHLDDSATITRSFAQSLGTLPVSFSSEERTLAEGLGNADFRTLGDHGMDSGRGASTTNRVSDTSKPLGYNGKQVQRYFTRTATDHVDVQGLSNASRKRLEAPKVMAQNIIAHVQNPYDHLVIAAVYDPVESYTFETVTNILLPDDAELSLPALSVLLNTQFVNWFVYYSIFNRAIRDMHLDRYFLERIVLPGTVTDRHCCVLEQLYGLLAVTNVAAEYDGLPDGEPVYTELQSIANALTYEMYLTEVDEHPLDTNLVGTVATALADHDVAYDEWYTQHLEATDADEVEALFHKNGELFETAASVVNALYCEAAVRDMEAIADHPWVSIIEADHHRREDAPPLFGPNTPE